MSYEKDLLQELREENEHITEQEIRKEFEEMKKENVEFVSFLSDFVLKTILLVASQEAKKCIYDVFSYVLKMEFKGYELSFNEFPKLSYLSIANRMDLHFVNEDLTSHILVEINPRDLETVKNRNLSYLFKMGGEFYSYLKGNLADKYKIPINVKLLNINDFNNKSYPDTLTLNYQDYIKKNNPFQLNEYVDVFNLYLPNFEKMVYNNVNEDIKKTIAMLHAKSYLEMEELAEGSLERMSLYSTLKKLGRDARFMVFRLEGEELEAFNASVRSELEDKAREEGLEQGISQTQEENAKRMLQDHLEIEKIAKYTGLSLDRIKEIENNMT